MANQKPITAERADWLIRQYGAATLRVLKVQRALRDQPLAECYIRVAADNACFPAYSDIRRTIAAVNQLPEVPA